MTFRTETLTLFPAMVLFIMASYLAFSTAWAVDASMKETLLIIASCFFLAGLIFTVCWAYYWAIHKTGNIGRA